MVKEVRKFKLQIFETWKDITGQWFGNLILVVVDKMDGRMYWVEKCLPSPSHVYPESQNVTIFGNMVSARAVS